MREVSWNISDWIWSALSQVGWRLMVASMAKSRRPLPSPRGTAGCMVRTVSRNLETSPSLDGAGDPATGTLRLSSAIDDPPFQDDGHIDEIGQALRKDDRQRI